MVHGIETDSKKYKHKKRNDEKYLAEDMLVWRRYIERDSKEKYCIGMDDEERDKRLC